jgi:hypothetical protein
MSDGTYRQPGKLNMNATHFEATTKVTKQRFMANKPTKEIEQNQLILT